MLSSAAKTSPPLVYCSEPASMQPTFALTWPAEKSNAVFATDSESRVPVMRNVERSEKMISWFSPAAARPVMLRADGKSM
jgi:hypothetical protein